MQFIRLKHDSDSDSLELDKALKYLSCNSLLQATLVNSNQINFYDESSIKQFTYDIPQPYSNGADPTGDLNTKEYEKFQKTVTNELNLCIGPRELYLVPSFHGISEDHAIIATDFESLEVHFNDSTLTLIYHFIGPQ